MESTVWICAVDMNQRQTRAYPVQCHGKRPSTDIALEFLRGIGCTPEFYRFYDSGSKLIVPPHALLELQPLTKPRVYLNELSTIIECPLLLFGNAGSFDGTYLSDQEFCERLKKTIPQDPQPSVSQTFTRVDEKPSISFFDADHESITQPIRHEKPQQPIPPPPVQFTFF